MTNDEKARAYDEALEIARKELAVSSPDSDSAKQIFRLFPELRESEDERLRRLLVWQVHRNIEDETNDLAQSVYNGIKGHDPDLEESIEDWKRCLAYLEKQKELTPADDWGYADKRMSHPLYLGGVEAGRAVERELSEFEKQKEQKEIPLMNGDADFYFDEWNQQKQNPTKRQCFEEGIRYAQRLQKEHFRDDTKKIEQEPAETTGKLSREDYLYQLLIDQLITYSDYEYLTGKKPAEWSEKHIADIFEKVGLAKIVREQGNDALTNAVQSAMIELSKVENAEWSEDYDEENIQTRFAFYTYKDDSSVLYLSNVFVEEASRNHGFGTKILRAAEKVAETIGAITISLKVKQDSPANAWYRKNGYGYVAFEDGYDWLEKNLEYMKPAKSTEWSEEDEDMLNCCISSIEEAKENRYAYKETDEDTSYDREIDWLKKTKFKYCVNPILEWSEDDVMMLERCVAALPEQGDEIMPTYYLGKLKDWLRDLPERFSLQQKQKWSEEDKKMMDSIINELGQHYKTFTSWDYLSASFSFKAYQKEIDWLKSLRPQPHWKPSEEQMNALKRVSPVHHPDIHLVSLYDDLLKLQKRN